MNSTYINIKGEWLTEWGLTPAEAVVYGYLHGWIVDGKKDLKQTQASMAAAVGMSHRVFKKYLQRLIEKRLVAVQHTPSGLAYACMLYNGEREQTYPKGTNVPKGNECTQSEGTNVPHKKGTNIPNTYIINDNIENITSDDNARVCTREGDGGSLVGVGPKETDRTEQQRLLGETLGVDALAEELRREVADGSAFADSAQRLYGIGRDDLAEYAGWFADKLRMDGVAYKTRSDFRRHFNNWLRIQMQRKIHEKTQRNGNNSTNRHQPQYSAEFMERLAADLTSGR